MVTSAKGYSLHGQKKTFAMLFTLVLLIAIGIPVSSARPPALKQFFLAVEKGDMKKVSSMLDKGIDINAADKGGRTALHLAVINNKTDIIALLLTKKPDLNARDSMLGATPLGYAVSKKYKEIVRMLLKEKPDLKTGTRSLPLSFHAVETGDMEIFRTLVDAGIDLNEKVDGYDNTNDVTLLMCAVKNGNNDIVRFLIEKGADVNYPDSYGDPVIMWAIYYGHPSTAELLLDLVDNINLNPEGVNGTALAIAERKGYKKLAERIKKRGGRM